MIIVNSAEDKLNIMRELVYGSQYDDSEITKYTHTITDAIKDNKKRLTDIYARINVYNDSIKEYSFDPSISFDIDIDSKLNEEKSRLKTINTQINSYEDLVKNKKETENELKRYPYIDEKEIEKIRDNIKSLNERRENILNYNKRIILRDKLLKYFPYIYNDQKYKELISVKEKREKFKDDLKNIFKVESIEELNNMKDLTKIFIRYQEFKENEDIKKRINKLEIHIIDNKKSLLNIILSEEYEDWKESKSRIEKTLYQFKNNIKSYVCPSCDQRLIINKNDKLEVEEKIDIDSLKNELKLLDKKISEYDDMKKNAKKYMDNISKAESEILIYQKSLYQVDITEDEISKVKSLSESKYNQKLIDKIDFFINQNKDLDFLKVDIDNDLLKKLHNGNMIKNILGDRIKDFIEDENSFIKILDIEDNLDEDDIVKLIKNDESKVKKIESDNMKNKMYNDQLNKINDKILDDMTIKNLIKDQKAIESQISYLQDLKIQYSRYKDYQGYQKKITNSEKEKISIEHRLVILESILAKIKKISIEPLEEIICHINGRLEYILDKLFEENNNNINVRFALQNNANTKAGINIVISSGDCVYPNINTVSGGEADRISFAISVVISELCSSKFLLLDECMASLDLDMREKCLDILREIRGFNRKIIVDICHESVEGQHDRVISV